MRRIKAPFIAPRQVIEGLSTGICTVASEFKTEGKRRVDLSIYRELQAVTGL